MLHCYSLINCVKLCKIVPLRVRKNDSNFPAKIKKQIMQGRFEQQGTTALKC